VELYNQLSDYISKQYGKAEQEDKKRNVAFALVILQRRFASSLYALLRSLERRKERLEEFLRTGSVEKREAFLELEELEEVEDSTEDEILEKEREWESVSLAKNLEELRQEIETIKTLIKKTKEIYGKGRRDKVEGTKESLGGGFKNHRGERRKQKDFDLYRIKGHLGVFAEKGKGLGLLGMHHTRWNALGGENKGREGLQRLGGCYDCHRRSGRGHKPSVLPHYDQLRHPLEPQQVRAENGKDPPIRTAEGCACF
jgi:hypothetical protein